MRNRPPPIRFVTIERDGVKIKYENQSHDQLRKIMCVDWTRDWYREWVREHETNARNECMNFIRSLEDKFGPIP